MNYKENDGQTVFMWTANYTPYPEVIKALLKAGADINVKDNRDLTAVDYARVSGNPKILKLFEPEASASSAASENLTEALLKAA